MINRRRAQKRPHRLYTRSVDRLVAESREKPATATAKPRRTPRKVKRREVTNRGLELNSLETLAALHWFLVRVPSGKELAAERILDDDGQIVFVPVETRFRRVNRYAKKKRELRFPLVPGYLLVGFLPDRHRWADLFRFRLVTGVVGHDGNPLRIPFREVRRLLQRHCAGEFLAPSMQQFMRSGMEFSVGDKVEVLDGPFEGHIAEVASITGNVAEMVLNILGGQRRVQVKVSDIGRAA